jgi:hypothetical protein
VFVGIGAIVFHLGKAAAAVFIVLASRRFSGRCKVFWADEEARGIGRRRARNREIHTKEEEEDAVASSMITPIEPFGCHLPTAAEF